MHILLAIKKGFSLWYTDVIIKLVDSTSCTHGHDAYYTYERMDLFTFIQYPHTHTDA